MGFRSDRCGIPAPAQLPDVARYIPRAEESLPAYAVAAIPARGLLVQIPEAVIPKHGPCLSRREADGGAEAVSPGKHSVNAEAVHPGEDRFPGGREASGQNDLADVIAVHEGSVQHCTD